MTSTEIQILYIVCAVCSFVPALVFHEFMHGFVAHLLEDNTAKKSGRVSLNPLKHIDPFGTVILPALLLFIGGPIFGYAKPVPYNPRNFKNPRVGDVIVGLAGPLGNLLLAIVGGLAMYLLAAAPIAHNDLLYVVLYGLFLPQFIYINLFLMFFNLLPIPPLDGSSIFALLVPRKYLPQYYRIQQYALPVFLIVIFILPSLIHIDIIGLYLNVTAGNLASVLMPH
ncbi:MAG: site-2 protease family protein [Anaerotardibacter sp.]